MDNIKHIKRIEFAPNSKYLKTMYMVNGEKLYKNVKLYAFILACVLFSNVIRIIVECFFMFDLLGFLQLIFNPFMGGRVSSLEMKVKPIMLLYPLIMFIWNFFRLRSQAEKSFKYKTIV